VLGKSEGDRAVEPRGSERGGRALAIVLLLLVAALGTFRLYRSPWNVSGLAVVPDSVEYAVAAQRLVTLGRYDIEIDGVAHPPWSTPWFSLMLAPLYALAPRELGAGIHFVLACALVALFAAFAIGRRFAGLWGGTAAALALLFLPAFAHHARLVLTDVPALAFALLACWQYLRTEEVETEVADPGSHASRPRDALVAGVFVALALSLRSVHLALLLPFALRILLRRRRVVANLTALALPPLAVLVATAVYQQRAFGDFRRTGYQYWAAVPYDYPELMFRAGNLPLNLAFLWTPAFWVPLAAGALGSLVLAWKRPSTLRPMATFVLLAALPPAALHLVHFWTDVRFHVFELSLAALLAGCALASLVPENVRRRTWILPLALLAAFFAPGREQDPPPRRRIVAEALASDLPDNAVILTGIDPVYLEPLVLRGTSRRVVPLSREVEYASKLVTRVRVPRLDPPPRDAIDHRAPALRAGGAREAVAFTADEAPEKIQAWVRAGVPVFLDGSFVPDDLNPQMLLSPGLALRGDPKRRWLAQFALQP